MNRQVGLWIDHKQAFIVSPETPKKKPDEYSRACRSMSDSPVAADEKTARRTTSRTGNFTAHLNRYYDDVIAHIRAAESILLFGPGEAKGELEMRLAAKGLGGRILGVETADKMTTPRIAAKVRQHFPG